MIEWARLDRKATPKPAHLMGRLFDDYEKKVIPTLKPGIQSDYLKGLKQLRQVFDGDKPAPIDAMTPQVIAQYRDARTAKVRANREIALLSTIFTFAREWGLTDKANPALAYAGTRRHLGISMQAISSGTRYTNRPVRISKTRWT